MDVVIVDTAGRLHTKTNLMAELEKMRRTAARVIPDAPHEVLLVLEATTGQNGLEQARKFTESSAVTGIILTKLDGTAKGGVVVAISRELNLPIRYVGVGEQIDDLLPFDPQTFVGFACSTKETMNRFLEEALELAARGVGRTSPNPAVGAVVVRDGEVVGRGFHTWAGVKHAEVLALWRRPGNGARLDALRHAGALHASRPDASVHRRDSGGGRAQGGRADGGSRIRRFPAAASCGLRDAGVEVEWIRAPRRERAEINEAFVHFMRTGRPLVTLKAAMTLDGKIAAPDDEYAPGHTPAWITSETAREHVQTLRHLTMRFSPASERCSPTIAA